MYVVEKSKLFAIIKFFVKKKYCIYKIFQIKQKLMFAKPEYVIICFSKTCFIIQ